MAANFRLYNRSFERTAKYRGHGFRAAPDPNVKHSPHDIELVLLGLLAAGLAALTAIFAKVGVEGVDTDLATLIRTFVIMLTLGSFV